MPTFQTLPGFREFYPAELARRNHLFRIWREAAATFGFAEYDGPVLEPLDLYRAKSGPEIEEQLFSFEDKGGRPVALRPEMTPTLCRMAGGRAASLRRPIKWFSIGEQYRYERQQKGRLRAFFQFNADILGEEGIEADIELIALLARCLTAAGLTEKDFYIRISDRTLWMLYLEAHGLDTASAAALLQSVDKLERAGEDAYKSYEQQRGPLQPEIREAVRALTRVRDRASLEAVVSDIDHDRLHAISPLAKEILARLHARLADWHRLLDGLDAMGLGSCARVDLGVVRGLAYYTGFVFEAFDCGGVFRALAGGGRYDGLVGKLGGPDLPAAGFAIGDVVLSEMLQAANLLPACVQKVDVYAVIGENPAERMAALRVIHALREAGISVEYPLRDQSFGKQFKAADQSGARLALIFGSDEVARGVVKVRNLAERAETEVPASGVTARVRDLLDA